MCWLIRQTFFGTWNRETVCSAWQGITDLHLIYHCPEWFNPSLFSFSKCIPIMFHTIHRGYPLTWWIQVWPIESNQRPEKHRKTWWFWFILKDTPGCIHLYGWKFSSLIIFTEVYGESVSRPEKRFWCRCHLHTSTIHDNQYYYTRAPFLSVPSLSRSLHRKLCHSHLGGKININYLFPPKDFQSDTTYLVDGNTHKVTNPKPTEFFCIQIKVIAIANQR